MLPAGLYAQAMQIAWEQVAHWESYMTASEAGAAIGLRAHSWREVANKLARLWIEMQHQNDSLLVNRLPPLEQLAA